MDLENMKIEKATERCNQLIKPEHANWIGISNQKAIETVLEELENKQNDINILQAQRDSMEYQFKQTKAELEKKNKVINEMAKYIATLDTDEDICKNIQCTDGKNKRHKNCSDCIKEYFTNKVEREDK